MQRFLFCIREISFLSMAISSTFIGTTSNRVHVLGVKRQGKSWKGDLFTDFQWSEKISLFGDWKDREVTFLSLFKYWKKSSFQL